MVGKCVNRYHTVDSNGYLKVKILNVLSLEDDADVGYILEVDLLYPEHIDDLHRDLTICPEHRLPTNSKLSKLMTTLYRKKYIVYYRNLKQCLEHDVTKGYRLPVYTFIQ